MHHGLAFVWPCAPWCECLAAGRVTYRSLFVQSETSAVTGAVVIGAQLGKAIGVASQCQRNNIIAKGKKTDSDIIDRLFTFEIQQCMIHPILLAGKRFGIPAVLALPSSYTFFNRRLCFVTTPDDSYCLQVIGSAERWSRVCNKLTHENTILALKPTQLQSPQECSHIIKHPPLPHLCLPATWH